MPSALLMLPGVHRPGLGEAEVQRVAVAERDERAVDGEVGEHVARLERDLDVAEVELLEHADVAQRGGDHVLRGLVDASRRVRASAPCAAGCCRR